MAIFFRISQFLFLLFPKCLFCCCCFSANFSSQDLCGFEEEGREWTEKNITVLDIIHIQFYDSFPYILILTLLFILELIVSFKYISCAKRHEGDIKNRNLQYKFFFSAAACYVRYTIYFFYIFGGAHRYWESLCLCIISDVLRVIVNWSRIIFFFLCLLPLKEKLE